MLIQRKCPFTGATNTMEINVTQVQLDAWEKYGTLIQLAMTDLTPDEQEFIKTGITPEMWEKAFG